MEKDRVYELYNAADAATMLENAAREIEYNKKYAGSANDEEVKKLKHEIERGLYWLTYKGDKNNLLAIADETIKQLNKATEKYNQIIAEA